MRVLLLAALVSCSPGHRASGPLPQQAYVWQRVWSADVRQSVAQASDLALVALAAEVDVSHRPPRTSRPAIDFAALRAHPRPVGLAIRIGSFGKGPGSRGLADDPAILPLLSSLARRLAAEARDQGLALSEIQLDYDCPESRLGEYTGLVRAVREAVAPVPVTITALPSWLRHDDEFSRLIEATDGYVLQVHSLEPPRRPDAEILLCDPEAARRWVESASRFGRPFRVALPTYGYVVAFGPGSEIVGISAEGPRPSWPRDAAIRVARSDPDAMARLVRDWTEDRPAELAGLIWYRLPAAGDRLNWPWPAFRAVLEGRAPRRELQTIQREPEPGLIEIDLVNAGETEMPWPSPVDFRWEEGALLAADGLAGYRVHPAGPREVRLQRGASAWDRPLRPGERRMVAWLRLGVP